MIKSRDVIAKYDKLIKDDVALVTNSVEGVHSLSFNDLLAISGLNRNALAEDIFQISIKTISRYQKEGKKFSPRISELVLKLISLYTKGLEVFGNATSFNNWLSKPAFGLGDKIPYSVLNTATGIDLIYEELVRIEFGDLA